MTEYDTSAMRPYEGVLTIAAIAKSRELRPAVLWVSPSEYGYIQMGLDYLHEYIDEEERSYLVMRTPERLLVGTDWTLKGGNAILYCRSPDARIDVLLAS